MSAGSSLALLKLIVLLLLNVPAGYCQSSTDTVQYRDAILKTAYDEFVLLKGLRSNIQYEAKRNIWSEVLVQDDGPESRTVVSQSLLTSDQYQMVLDAWENRRQNFDYVRLTCWSAENRMTISNVQCYCTSFVRKNASVEDENAWSYVDARVCSEIPDLRVGVFANLDRVKTFELANVVLRQVEDEIFSELSALEMLFFTSSRLSPSAGRSVARSLCNGRLANLTGINVTDTYLEDADGRGILQTFDCPFDEQTRRLKVRIIRVTYCNVSLLTRTSFSSVDPSSLLSLNLSNNAISSIDGDTFADFVNLLELILADNRLTQLPPNWLGGLHSLRYVDLSGNAMESFSTESIANSPKLRLLNLCGSQVKEINGSFGVAEQLWYIYLDDNLLTEIESSTFLNCTNLTVLSLKNNRIFTINEFAFRDLENVWKLRLSRNFISNSTALSTSIQNSRLRELREFNIEYNNMTYLPSDFIGHVSNQRSKTKSIHLSYNQLEFVHPDALRGLDRLRTLILSHNLISHLDANVFARAKRLRKLDLCYNRLVTLSPDLFAVNKELHELLIHHNQLLDLPEGMTMASGMGLLHLQNNRLTVVPSFDRPLRELTLFELSGNRLTNISWEEMSRFPKLLRLNLHNNLLTSLSAGVFSNNSDIRELTLHRNELELNFTVDYFSPGASKLLNLTLNDNRIRSVDKLFMHTAFCSARVLNLSGNPVGMFWSRPYYRCNTTHLYMRNCTLTTIPQAIFAKSTHLRVFDMSENNVTQFMPLETGSARYMVLIDSNPIVCSCTMRWLKTSQHSKHYKLSKCIHAATGKLTSFATIPESEFLCRLRECSVKGCECFKDDRNASNLPTHLLCSNKRLSVFPNNLELTIKVIHFDGNNLVKFSTRSQPSKRIQVKALYLDDNRIVDLEQWAFQKFPNIEILGLSGNRLTHISADVFYGMTRLTQLLVANNRISEIDPNVFEHLPNLVTLQLHSNDLQNLSDQTLNELDSLPSLANLTLHDNPFICSCDNSSFRNWILSHADVIPNNRTGIECNGTSILTRSDQDFICYDTRLHVFVKDYLKGPLSASLTAALLLLLIVFSLVLSYRHRHVLQVKLYNTRFRLRLRRPENLNCLYDAIVMYDADNDVVRQWTQEQLRPRLLQFDPQFRLFIPDLDLGLGFDELNCIVDGVTQSRRTIVVVDEGSCDNPYVLYSFKFAYHHMTTDEKLHDVLLVLTDNLDVDSLLNDDRVDANFKAFLAAGKTVTMSGRHLWEELNYFMPQSTTDVSMIPMENYEHQEWEPLLPGPGTDI